MHNPYLEYYTNQAGSGLAGFQGLKYQRGHGFFGSLFGSILQPLAQYLGTKALSTGVAIGNDYLKTGDLKGSASRRLKSAGRSIINDALDKANSFVTQKGGGKKRKRRRYKQNNSSNKKIKKNANKSKKKRPKKKKSFKRKNSASKHLKNLFA